MLYDQQKPPPFVSKYPDIFLKKSFLFPRKKHYFFFFLWSNPQLLFFIYFCHVISSLQRESGIMYKIHKVHIKAMLAYISYVDVLWCRAVLVYELTSASTCYLVKEEDLVDKYHPLVILRVVVSLINPQILPVSTNHKILLPVQKSYFRCQKRALSPDCKLFIVNISSRRGKDRFLQLDSDEASG